MAVNAKVRLNISINSVVRDNVERFRPTYVNTEAFNLESDLVGYSAAIAQIASDAYTAVQTRRAEGATCTVHLDVWLENATHVTPAAGVVVLPKGNITGMLNDEEVASSQSINDLLSVFVTNLKSNAGY